MTNLRSTPLTCSETVILAVVGGVVVAGMLILGLAFLFAYPTMWLVNYLFTPTVLTAVFGVSKFGVYQAMALNTLAGLLVKSGSGSSSSKKD